MVRGYYDLDQFIEDYIEEQVKENPNLEEICDVGHLECVFTMEILKEAVCLLLVDREMDIRKALDMVISCDENIAMYFGWAIDRSRFGAFCN